MKQLAFLLGLIFLNNTAGSAQVTIGQQSFDGATPTITFTNTGGGTITGNSAAGDRPASSNYFVSSNTAFSTLNGTSTLTLSNTAGLASYTNKFFEFRLASWSIGSTGNGADGADIVTASISLDGGTTFSDEVRVAGNANAFWHYTTGTGLATTVYDGNNAPTVFTPAAGGGRTTDGFSTVRIDLPNGCTQAILRITSLNNSTAERWTIDDIRLVGTLSAPCVISAAPTTNATTLNTTTFCTSSQISFTAGNGANRIAVVSTSNFADVPVNGQAYTPNTTFGAGEAMGAGNFTVLNGSGSFVTITGLTAGTTYFIKIFEYNGTSPDCNEGYLTTSVLSGSFTTQSNCATPQVRSILADACSSQEGLDELVIIENGANPLNVSDISLAFPSGGTYCNTTCGGNTLLNNPTYINQLNTLAGCTLFQYADPIPAGGIIIVFTGLTPSYTFDYSTQCPSSSTYYAVFCNNASTAGRFANTAAAGVFRTLNCTFAGVSESVTYEPNQLGGDGSFIDFDNAGNPIYRTEANCIYPLGVELVNFVGAKNDESILLSWSTIIEKESAAFEVKRITDSGNEELIATINSQGNSESIINYQFEDIHPNAGVNYYQLHQIDRNGKMEESKTIAVQFSSETQVATYLEQGITFTQTLNEGDFVTIFSIDGKQIASIDVTEKTNKIPVDLSSGTWIVTITKRNGQEQLLKCVVVN